MKTYFKFDLDDPDDEYKYKVFSRAQDFHNFLWEVLERRRKIIKYNTLNLKSHELDIAEKVLDFVLEGIEEYEIQ